MADNKQKAREMHWRGVEDRVRVIAAAIDDAERVVAAEVARDLEAGAAELEHVAIQVPSALIASNMRRRAAELRSRYGVK